MAPDADEDDDAQVNETDDENREPGPEGDGADGADSTTQQPEEGDLPTKRTDAEGDEGAPSSRGAPQHDAQSRGSARYQRLANENREYRERLERLERERENDRQQWQRQQTQLNEQQERERLALMTPEERADYRIVQHRQQTDAQLNQFRMQTLMQMDKSSYDAKAVNNAVYRRMADQVEALFAEQLRKNQPTDRETILYHLLGKMAANGAANSKPRAQARRRVENERVAPSSGKGDTARGSTRRSSAEDRLKDVLI
jgi:hypothetical protein